MKIMGITYADIQIENYYQHLMSEDGLIPIANVKKTEMNILVDTGAIRMVINESICNELELKVKSKSNVTLADGTIKNIGVVGPIRIFFKDRECITDAYVLDGDNEPLMGVIP
jgi:clan AA aspartic protease